MRPSSGAREAISEVMTGVGDQTLPSLCLPDALRGDEDALASLTSRRVDLPSWFAPLLLSRVTTFRSPASFRSALELLGRSRASSIAGLKEKMTSSATQMRQSPPSTRDGLKLIRIACRLFEIKELKPASLELLLSGLEALETTRTPSTGPQRRSKRAALAAGYKCAAKLAIRFADMERELLEAPKLINSAPYMVVVALGVVSRLFGELAAAEQRVFLITAVTACVKAGKGIAEAVIRVCGAALQSEAVANFVHDIGSVVEKFLLRDLNKAMPASECLFLALRIDLSAVVRKRFLPAVLQALKSSEDSTRAHGVRFAAALGLRVRGSAALAECIQSIFGFLNSAKYSYQRIAAANAIAAVACCAKPILGNDILDASALRTALHGTLNWIQDREPSEKARRAGIGVVVRVASFAIRFQPKPCGLERPIDGCLKFLLHVLKGTKSDFERPALLAAMTEENLAYALPMPLFGDEAARSLRDAVLDSKLKPCDCLRAVALLIHWAQGCSSENSEGHNVKLCDELADATVRSLLSEADGSLTLDEEICALRCSEWLVRCNYGAADKALGIMFKFCVYGSHRISRVALRYIRGFRQHEEEQLNARLVMVLWNRQFCGDPGASSVARSCNFDDGMRSAERLGRVLLTVSMPSVPSYTAPFAAMAANHPRLIPKPSPRCVKPRSRFWVIMEKNCLRRHEGPCMKISSNRLNQCLNVILGPLGIQSADPVVACAAKNTLAALANNQKLYSEHVLRRAVAYLSPVALAIHDSHEKEHCMQTASQVQVNENVDTAGMSLERKTQIGTLSHDRDITRPNQTQRGIDGKVQGKGESTSEAIQTSTSAGTVTRFPASYFRMSWLALDIICMLCLVAPKGMHRLTCQTLSPVMSCAKSVFLERPCRNALSALTSTCGPRIRHLSLELSSGLFDSASDPNERRSMTEVIRFLREIVPPALAPEDFFLIAPVLRAAMLSRQRSECKTTPRGTGRSMVQKVRLAVVKGATEVLLEHCKPNAFGSASAAAASGAGYWIVDVLEREDAAFSIAADALALLSETVLKPGAEHLPQVLTALVSGKAAVRDAALHALVRIPQLNPSFECPRDSALGRALWLVRYDGDEANAELADVLWGNYNHPLNGEVDVLWMIGLLAHDHREIRVMAAKATAAALYSSRSEGIRSTAIPKMFMMYLQNRSMASNTSPPRCRSSSQKRKSEAGPESVRIDHGWHVREGVALALEQLAEARAFKTDDAPSTFVFLVGQCLGDYNEIVRGAMSKAAIALVKAIGTKGPNLLLPMIEKELTVATVPLASSDEVLCADRTRENLVMCLGCVAGFLPATDPRVKKITDRVIHCALETPSEAVQNAAARCLLPLVRVAIPAKEEADITDLLLTTVLEEGAGYGRRRGAAYALAGISTGLGLRYVRRCRIISRIRAELSGKSAFRRQGAFMLIETSAVIMGGCFEPYTVAVLPFLLSCMGDPVLEVRNACWAAVRSAMSGVSSHCAKKIVPMLISGLRDRQWRTKAGSADVLGAMAFCAPRQLAECLPDVVPVLAETLADAHPRVVASAESALNRILAVVRNPEVRKLSPFLLAALRDPAGKTSGAINAMLESEFVHAIDATSLALLIPPLSRGLRDRSSKLKEKSAAIVGSMCDNVSNPRHVALYLGFLLPALRSTLLDAIPDVRRASARALGSLARALGEDELQGLVPWLMRALLGGDFRDSLNAPTTQGLGNEILLTSVERAGAAMGLAEIASSMADDRLEDVLDRLMTAGEVSTDAREGALLLIAHMPRSMGQRFEGKLGTSLSAILKGLADDSDAVRESALEAGRSIVAAYARTSLDRLLPEILAAAREQFWRIRLAATHLLGDLLLVITESFPEPPKFEVSAGSGDFRESSVSDVDHDIGHGPEAMLFRQGDMQNGYPVAEQMASASRGDETMAVIEKVLGVQCRNEVFATLYIVRCDISARVRQAGMRVWKTLVLNTPRVLREVLPRVVGQVVEGLADENEERRAALGRALGDLSQKLGSQVLPEVLPALRNGIMKKSSSERERKGACEGLHELIRASPKECLEEHAEELAQTVYNGLCDEYASVRMTSAEVFETLSRSLGTPVADAVLPMLVQSLSSVSESDERNDTIALDALKRTLAVSGQPLMKSVVSMLLREQPLGRSSARMLAVAASVGESAFGPYVQEVTEAVIAMFETCELPSSVVPFEDVVGAIASCGDQSFDTLLERILSKFSESHPLRRMAASRICGALCRAAPLSSVSRVADRILQALVVQLVDADRESARSAWEALRDLAEAIPNSVLSSHIPLVRQSMRSARMSVSGDDSVEMLGLQAANASEPFVHIFVDGLLSGNAELAEQAALGIAELVEWTSISALGRATVKFTGPLIRVMSARFPWQVKAAVLQSLLALLQKASGPLRSFVPQLQSIFVRSISDSNPLVRRRACTALAALVPLQTRLGGLLNDLLSLGETSTLSGSRATAYDSCAQVFLFGRRLPESICALAPGRIAEGLSDKEQEVRKAAGRALGSLSARSTDADQYVAVLNLVLQRLGPVCASQATRLGALQAVGEVVLCGKHVCNLQVDHLTHTSGVVQETFRSSTPEIRSECCATGASVIVALVDVTEKHEASEEHKESILRRICQCAENDSSPSVRVAALQALERVIAADSALLVLSARALVSCAAEINSGIRKAADRVFRRLFLSKEARGNVNTAKQGLGEQGQKFLDRRITALRNVGL